MKVKSNIRYHIYLWLLLTLFIGYGCKTAKQNETITYTSDKSSDFFDSYQSYLFGDSVGSSASFLKLVNKYPDEGDFWFLLGRAQAAEGFAVGAKASIEKAISLDSNNVTYLKMYHTLLEQEGEKANMKEMIAISEQIYQLDSSSFENTIILAKAYVYTEGYQQQCLNLLLPRYEDWAGQDPVDAFIILSYLMLEKKDSAEWYLSRYMRSEPSSEWSARNRMMNAAMLQNDSLVELAYQQGLSLGCMPVDMLLLYVNYERERGRFLGALETISELFPGCEYPLPNAEQLHYQLVEFLQGVTDERVIVAMGRIMEKTGKQYPESGLISEMALRFAIQLKNYPYAEQMLRQLIARDPRDIRWVYQLVLFNHLYYERDGVWHERSSENDPKEYPIEHWDRDTKILREVIDAYPLISNSPLFYCQLSYLVTDSPASTRDTIDNFIGRYEEMLNKTGKTEEFEFLNEKLEPQKASKQQLINECLSDLYAMKGDLYHQEKADSEAFSCYEVSLKYNNDNALVLNNYAYYLCQNGNKKDLRRAKRMSERSLEFAPENESYLDTYGYILYLMGDYQESRKVFIKLFSIHKNPSSVILLHYSELLEALGEPEAAAVYRMKAEKASRN